MSDEIKNHVDESVMAEPEATNQEPEATNQQPETTKQGPEATNQQPAATENVPEQPQSVPPPKQPRRRRSDKAMLHVTRNGVLSRALLDALVRRGENLRQLRALEQALRDELRPNGAVAEMIFDRMWSSFLRCLLIARSEARVLTADSLPTTLSGLIPGLPKREKPAFTFDDLSMKNLEYVALVQRYDSHFSRDCFRMMAILVAMRDGDCSSFQQQLEKAFGKKKNSPDDDNRS